MYCVCLYYFVFFFFKQKTAYEMRISDWSSDVCSSDLEAVRLNKKVLCFVDEYGTAGTASFHLGAVFVLANEAGRLDKCFSDLLEPNANEVHAANMSDGYLQGLLQIGRAS